MSERRAKRRRVDSTQSSGRLGEFNLRSFRKRLACFFLVAPLAGSKSAAAKLRQYTFAVAGVSFRSAKTPLGVKLIGEAPSRLAPLCPDDVDWFDFLRSLVDGPTVLEENEQEVASEIEKMIHVCLNGFQEKQQRRARRPYMIRRTETGEQCIRRLFGLYRYTDVKKVFCQRQRLSILGIESEDMLKKMLSFGKDSFLGSLSELFRSGTLPHARREEEERALEEIDLSALQFELNGKFFPLELMKNVMAFLPHNYELIETVGLVSWNFYVLVLSTWKKVSVSKNRLLLIPKVVWQSVDDVWLGLISLNLKEPRHAFDCLSRNSLRSLRMDIPYNSKQVICIRRFGLLWKSCEENGKLMNLRSIDFEHFHSDFRTMEKKVVDRWMAVRLAEVAPNLEIVLSPGSLLWCENLRVKEIAVQSHILARLPGDVSIPGCMEGVTRFRLDRRFRETPQEETRSRDFLIQILPQLVKCKIVRFLSEDVSALTRANCPHLESLCLQSYRPVSAFLQQGLVLAPNLRDIELETISLESQLVLIRPVLRQHLSHVKLDVGMSLPHNCSELLAEVLSFVHRLASLRIRWIIPSATSNHGVIEVTQCGQSVSIFLPSVTTPGVATQRLLPDLCQRMVDDFAENLFQERLPHLVHFCLEATSQRVYAKLDDELESDLSKVIDTGISRFMVPFLCSYRYRGNKQEMLAECVVQGSSKTNVYTFSKSLLWSDSSEISN